jgi:uncharacterized protein (UPF0548 family)
MFLARRPLREAIDRFVRDSQELPLSYGPIGIVNGETPCRDLDEVIVTIGRGRTDFDRARAALVAWKQFDIRAEGGEELFEVFLDPQTDHVKYRIRAVSWPRLMLTRFGQPIVHLLQARFRRDSAKAMTRATRVGN